jgi:hypothetical protein
MRKVKTNPQQLRDTIKLLYSAGESDVNVALKVGMTVAEVIKEREGLGLELATTVAIVWTAAEDSEIMRLRDVKCLRWTEVAKTIGTGKLSKQCQARYKELDNARTRINKNGSPSHRNCMGCSRKFFSEGHHVRFCNNCRDARDGDSHIVTHGNFDFGGFE